MKSKHFDLVKKMYDTGVWGIGRVKDAVVKKWITKAEYKEITGETYVAA